MSVNINIQVPLEVVAAIKASASSNDGNTPVGAQVPAAINSAVVDAVKALPFEIRASRSLAAPPNAPVTASFSASDPFPKAMTTPARPEEVQEDKLANDQTISIMVPGVPFYTVLKVSPDNTLGDLRSQIFGPFFAAPGYVLMHEGRKICAMFQGVDNRFDYEDIVTLQQSARRESFLVESSEGYEGIWDLKKYAE
ncbi:hypothetical protein AC578_6427 [Pseudocercospora eumusae]|uniref:Uncharacterized protein n=1 Tax=Pseudocercospora eumusae TaxID=321146 RepID=A0A139H6W0_9PEZI|nr:hypothetical protein AC578_6427 [Pseudocercospora eumusae]